MGMESSEWYNTQILVGMTDQRGHAWHYKKDMQGSEPNHYAGAIPVEDVQRRLFSWSAVEAPVFIQVPASMDDATSMDENGKPVKFIKADNRKAILRDDSNDLFEIFKDGYAIHQYNEWLVKNLANLIDDELAIGSAGLLKNGGVAWVSLEMPESVEVIEGFSVRPHLLATTSHIGTLATTYKKVSTFVVCDNTHSMAMGEDGEQFKARHSKHSALKIQTARDALGIIHKMTDDVVAEITKLSEWKVTDDQWTQLLNQLVPVPQDPEMKTAITRAENKRWALKDLYANDLRVAPWKGSALGVLQAYNTYNHHKAGTDKNRVERNMLNALSGSTGTADAKVLQALASL